MHLALALSASQVLAASEMEGMSAHATEKVTEALDGALETMRLRNTQHLSQWELLRRSIFNEVHEEVKKRLQQGNLKSLITEAIRN